MFHSMGTYCYSALQLMKSEFETHSYVVLVGQDEGVRRRAIKKQVFVQFLRDCCFAWIGTWEVRIIFSSVYQDSTLHYRVRSCDREMFRGTRYP